MKKAVLKTAFAVVIAVLAFAFVTCDILETPEEEDGVIGFTDVEYTYTGSSGDVRIKSVKIYLDGTVVPRTAAQRKLDLEAARMGHDFFEVVFWHEGGVVARTSWEIGYQAGISGVDRGHDYGPHAPPTLTSGTAASAIFVGKKSSKTLLGVGYLSHVDDELGETEIVTGTGSVTFTVSPLKTWLGFEALTPFGVKQEGGVATFMTSTITPTSPASPTLTSGKTETLRAGANYPQFDLPSVRGASVPSSAGRTVNATYTIGGLNITGHNLKTAVRTWGAIGGSRTINDAARAGHTTGNAAAVLPPDNTGFATWSGANARGGLQFIKRTPAFLYQGTTYGLPNNDDKVTTVKLVTETPSDQDFADVMEIIITQYPRSGGVFAITFQQPVYLLTIFTANNPGGTSVKAEKWFVRPDYGLYQYMLDNGEDSGGAVLLATDLIAGGGDWIEIKTTGIGFDNE